MEDRDFASPVFLDVKNNNELPLIVMLIVFNCQRPVGIRIPLVEPLGQRSRARVTGKAG